ncbi:hypothetical protein RCL1_000633 [Eukaryota sp. TZLM3-RCL]
MYFVAPACGARRLTCDLLHEESSRVRLSRLTSCTTINYQTSSLILPDSPQLLPCAPPPDVHIFLDPKRNHLLFNPPSLPIPTETSPKQSLVDVQIKTPIRSPAPKRKRISEPSPEPPPRTSSSVPTSTVSPKTPPAPSTRLTLTRRTAIVSNFNDSSDDDFCLPPPIEQSCPAPTPTDISPKPPNSTLFPTPIPPLPTPPVPPPSPPRVRPTFKWSPDASCTHLPVFDDEFNDLAQRRAISTWLYGQNSHDSIKNDYNSVIKSRLTSLNRTEDYNRVFDLAKELKTRGFSILSSRDNSISLLINGAGCLLKSFQLYFEIALFQSFYGETDRKDLRSQIGKSVDMSLDFLSTIRKKQKELSNFDSKNKHFSTLMVIIACIKRLSFSLVLLEGKYGTFEGSAQRLLADSVMNFWDSHHAFSDYCQDSDNSQSFLIETAEYVNSFVDQLNLS